MLRSFFFPRRTASAAVLLLCGHAAAQSNPGRGLWVGEVTLRYVNEVTVPLDQNNVPVAPNPAVVTPTSDDANVRFILHVNGAGQVSLLKDVALVKRKPDNLESDSDIALVTDESLYGAFPPQAAQRVATATFDFGDPKATGALSKVVETAITAAYAPVGPLTQSSLVNQAARATAVTAAFNAANAASAAPAVIPTADVAAAFNLFLTSTLNLARVDQLAAAADPGGNAGLASAPASLRGKAKALADASFYGDRRAVDMVEALVTAVAAAPAAAKQSTARAVAASYADVNNEYQRFTAGQIFGGMITSTASSMATAAKVRVAAPITALLTSSGGTATEVVAAAHGLQTGQQVTISGSSLAALNGTHPVSVLSVNNFVVGVPFSAPASGAALGDWFRSDQVTTAAASNPAGQTAATEAIRIQVTAYNDQRALNALALVKAAMLEAALKAVFDSALLPEGARGTAVETAAVNAGRQALAERVPRYAVPAGAPSTEYNNFVRSATYAASAQKAAQAVAAAMVEEKATNALAGEASIKGKALAAALRALDAEFSAAARSLQTFVRVDPGPVGGGFGAGKGDARLTVDLSGTSLGGAALTALLVLPASHPTNPFRHRRHPDHTQGFDITRKLRFDFDAVDPGTGTPAGFGVDRLTGVYREEIFGLHKPLGPDPVNNPIGLRVEGRFTLHRISLIDTLNAR